MMCWRAALPVLDERCGRLNMETFTFARFTSVACCLWAFLGPWLQMQRWQRHRQTALAVEGSSLPPLVERLGGVCIGRMSTGLAMRMQAHGLAAGHGAVAL